MNKLKVLIADDTITYRKILSEAVESTGLALVERTASNGLLVLEWMKQLNDIDVVLLDVFMPELDGIETLKVIKKDYPGTDVIIISGGGTNNAALTIQALELGAVDFVLKPAGDSIEKNMERIKNQLHTILAQITIKKIGLTSRAINPNDISKVVPTVQPRITNTISQSDYKKSLWAGANIVLIASSTGGPSALDTILSGITQNINKPVLIVQHMPPEFTKVLAQSLDKKCLMKVSEGQEGDQISNGQILLAPGGFHMAVGDANGSTKAIKLLDSPYVNGVRPAADILFQSVAKAYEGKNILIVILTGMGNDGMQGVMELKKKCNCYCITQSESTCVVYGMPRCTYEAGLSDEVVDLKNIALRIQQVASGRC